ncbi:site-2 protease family protein [Priestia taiwanensis]|uniref:Zinc metalloprotease n=1 Tax=Priestia taiwanensis TaxID=1347902 RepID=A0A917AWC2_9BACI|nr:site-2 protease family protein [Priestia taiwanensis]MBM7364943.1 Zn-dependent protease [Priestia taiwanensis]GGE82324.1 zinc metalloprotease [Priestia taiwanensis]
MEGFLRFQLDQIPFVAISLIIAFTVHELAHAYVAYKFGDPTAKNEGRLTLNPIAHLDPIGTLLIFIAGFGWARPVPVNRSYFKRPRLAGVLVALAGPLSNLIIAFLGIFIWEALINFHLVQALDAILPRMDEFVRDLFNMLVFLNVMLFVFNLIPFPPLDGYRILEDLAPDNIRSKMISIEPYGGFIFLFLVITPLGSYIFTPIFKVAIPFVISVLYGIIGPLFGY